MLTFRHRPGRTEETSFGYYIRGGDRVGERLFRVVSSPRSRTATSLARQWVESGEYRWGSGVFVWRCSTFTADRARGPTGPRWPRRSTASQSAGPTPGVRATARGRCSTIRVDPRSTTPCSSTRPTRADGRGLVRLGRRRLVELVGAAAAPGCPQGNVLFGDAVALECERRCVVVGEEWDRGGDGTEGHDRRARGGRHAGVPDGQSEQVRRVSGAASARTSDEDTNRPRSRTIAALTLVGCASVPPMPRWRDRRSAARRARHDAIPGGSSPTAPPHRGARRGLHALGRGVGRARHHSRALEAQERVHLRRPTPGPTARRSRTRLLRFRASRPSRSASVPAPRRRGRRHRGGEPERGTIERRRADRCPRKARPRRRPRRRRAQRVQKRGSHYLLARPGGRTHRAWADRTPERR